MIQIRHVPEATHKRLRIKALQEGLTLSDYLLREVTRIANWPTVDEIRQTLAHLPAPSLNTDLAAVIREERPRR